MKSAFSRNSESESSRSIAESAFQKQSNPQQNYGTKSSPVPLQKKASQSVNGITHSENESVKQLTNGSVDLHSSGAKVKEVSSSDSRLKSVGARSMAVGGQALIGDRRDRGHEIWHLAQQAQRRVQPTTSVNGQALNDNPKLEKEADSMGARIA